MNIPGVTHLDMREACFYRMRFAGVTSRLADWPSHLAAWPSRLAVCLLAAVIFSIFTLFPSSGQTQTSVSPSASPADSPVRAAAAERNRYYVKPTGSDSDVGTSWGAAFKTLLKAAQVVQAGDEVWVAAGTYQETNTVTIPSGVSFFGGFASGETDLSRRDWTLNPTSIDGQKSRRCVNNYGILDGFYVRNGYSADTAGGIYNYGSVTNCMVYDNTSKSAGGGICSTGSSSSVSNCTVRSNKSWGAYYCFGGGIYSAGGLVVNCTLCGNTALGGGGIYTLQGLVTNCKVYGNTAQDSGGGIYSSAGSVTCCEVYDNTAPGAGGIACGLGSIAGCKVYNNAASGYEGGIGSSRSLVASCVVYGNISNFSGGGIHSDNDTIANCTVYYNIASMDGGGIWSTGMPSSITNCIAWSNVTSDIVATTNSIVSHSCFKEARSETDNIALYPLFVNVSGDVSTWDLRLRPGSPCIDTGTSEGAPATDILGVVRPQGRGFDMGAYEWMGIGIPGDISGNGALGPEDATLAAAALRGGVALTTEQSANADANQDGVFDIADLIWIQAAIAK